MKPPMIENDWSDSVWSNCVLAWLVWSPPIDWQRSALYSVHHLMYIHLDGIWNMESAFTEFMIISCYRKDRLESAKTSLLLLLSILLTLITKSLVMWCIFVQSSDNHPLVTSHNTMDVWIVGTITGISCCHILFYYHALAANNVWLVTAGSQQFEQRPLDKPTSVLSSLQRK